MAAQTLNWNSELLPDGVLRLAFVGTDVGPCGVEDHLRMGQAIRDALELHSPAKLIVDFRGYEYRFGDWIGAAPLAAWKALGQGRVCVLATGQTAVALASLWKLGLGQIIPLVGDLREALIYLSESAGDISDMSVTWRSE